MKKLAAIVIGAALTALAGCTTTETTNTGTTNANAVVTNTNTTVNANVNTNTTANANTRHTYNANISEEEYNKDKERYGSEARQAGDTIGSGLKDGWLWVKTRGALATVDDLRDSTINVDVNDGVITLRGSVANAQQKAAAVKVANSIEGKKSVKDELTINPNAGVMSDGANNNANANHNANMGNHNK